MEYYHWDLLAYRFFLASGNQTGLARKSPSTIVHFPMVLMSDEVRDFPSQTCLITEVLNGQPEAALTNLTIYSYCGYNAT